VQVAKTSDNEIVVTRTFAAPRDAVFAALTQAEHLLHWMKSTDMAFVACEVDLRVGGTFRYVFQRSNGFKIEVRGAYQAVDPPRRLVYTETYDFSPLTILVTTALDMASEGTVFRQTLRYSSREERDGDFDAVATSAAEAYTNLERYLARR
jgi:uncharacterized protein YndB with AHSA1/START domain